MKSVTYILFLGFLAAVSPSLGFTARYGAASVAKDNLIYVFGGKTTEPLCQCVNDYSSDSSEVSIYEVDTDNFWDFEAPRMNQSRAFHSAVIVENKVYIFGGHSDNTDLEVFDIENAKWSLARVHDDHLPWTPKGERPSARHSHASIAIGHKIYIFGGIDAATGNALNDLWYYHTYQKKWTEVTGCDVAPSPRAGVTLFPVVNGFAIFGGFDTAAVPRYLNTLWRFDAVQSRWYHATPEVSPSPRAYSTALFSPNWDERYLFGGEAPSTEVSGETVFFDDVWSLYVSAESVFWERKNPNNGGVPSARSGAAGAWSIPAETFFIFFGHNEQREPLADVWEYQSDFRHWTQGSCLPGYYFPSCQLDCADTNWCSGHGTCLSNHSCCCDAGWVGDDCGYNVCDDYRGFTTEELNQILLPKSFESTYHKLGDISKKLEHVRELLPSIDAHHVNMTDITEETYTFYQSCLVHDICEVADCFENLVGCDSACGAETFCVVGDVCQNGQCLHGTPRDCSEDFANNSCVNSWCDETYGCMHSTVTCEDDDPCTINTCDPARGCVVEHITCDDGDCCTTDFCHHGKCFHKDKCEDENPCTIDSCVNDCHHNSECHYEFEEECYPNVGQNHYSDLCPWETEPKPRGEPLHLLRANTVPTPELNSGNALSRTATAFAWLRGSTCELIYEIDFDEAWEDDEDGAHIYGHASTTENAGVVHTLRPGHKKVGSWNYCKDDISTEDLLSGNYYIQIWFGKGDVRAQLNFHQQGFSEDCPLSPPS